MFGIEELKEPIELNETTVGCPVKSRNKKVEQLRKVLKKEDRFFCPEQKICISPSSYNKSDEVN